MTNQDPLHRYFHHASAFGIAGQINRPRQQTIAPQAATTLPPSGGHGTHRVENYSIPGIVSFGAASVEVGGSYDADNETHATYATAVIEDLNIFNVVTADRLVSRLTVYHPALPSATELIEPSFSIAGSNFDNLRVNGEEVDVRLDTQAFHDSKYSNFCAGMEGTAPSQKHLFVASNIDLSKLSQSDHNYAIVSGIAKRYQEWDPEKNPISGQDCFWCSAANRREWAHPASQATQRQGSPSGITNFGGVICVPRFGVIYLAEVLVHRNHRHLTMIRVQMCSPAGGNIDGGGVGTTGNMPPRP